MSPSPAPRAVVFRWDQILVLAAVVVLSDYAGVAWLTRDIHRPAAPMDAETAARASAPDASVLDDEMGRSVRRLALQRGLNPTNLPDLGELWALASAADPSVHRVDVEDRDAVLAAFEGYLRSISSAGATSVGVRTGAGVGGVGGGGGAGGGGAASGELPPPGAGGGGGLRLAPSIARLDELHHLRLVKLAAQNGIDPARVMPSEDLRQAALASDDPGSEASLALMDLYRSALMALDTSSDLDR